ncbi:MAG: amidohydrolase family protein [Burkholderiaceae bacterium]|nr:amidohydrolase family protein [Burkholderiaceae bacterium]
MQTSSSPEMQATPPVCLPWQPAGKPRHRLPAGATDCHCHVYEDPTRYPLTADRSYTPVQATRDDYLATCAMLGIDRTVQVSASVYGADNSLTLDVIAQFGQHRARGVAGLAPDTTEAQVRRLHEGGMRGVRVSSHVRGYGGLDAIDALAPKIGPLGWHVQLHFAHADEIAAHEDRLMRLQVPIVFDHMGGVRDSEGVGNAGFQAMLRILRQRDDCWSKISSWHRRSDSGAPQYAGMQPLVQAMVDARPDRLVFGTNWPNPALFPPASMTDDAALVDSFCDWVPHEATRRAILVTNPERLYGFETPA